MVNRDLIFSIVLHGVVVAATLFASPLQLKKTPPFGEVIRINAVSMGDIMPAPKAPEQPVAIPRPAAPEPEQVPISEPTTKPEVKIDKPAEKPKPEAESRPDDKVADEGKAGGGTGEGEVDVGGGAGSAISGVRVDNAAFNHPYWFTMAWNKINQNYRFAVTIDGKVYCDVYFVVIKSGRVIETKLVNSSGIPAFDQACLTAVERSSPLPPLPREWLDEIIGITITFTNNQ